MKQAGINHSLSCFQHRKGLNCPHFFDLLPCQSCLLEGRRIDVRLLFVDILLLLFLQLALLGLPPRALPEAVHRIALSVLLPRSPAAAHPQLPPAVEARAGQRRPQEGQQQGQEDYLDVLTQRRVGRTLCQPDVHHAQLDQHHEEVHHGEEDPVPELDVGGRGGLEHDRQELRGEGPAVSELVAVPDEPDRHEVKHQSQKAHAGEVEAAALQTVEAELPARVDAAHQAQLRPLLISLRGHRPSRLQEEEHEEGGGCEEQKGAGDSVEGVHGRPVAEVPQVQASESENPGQNGDEVPVPGWPQIAGQFPRPLVLCADGGVSRERCEGQKQCCHQELSRQVAQGHRAEAVLLEEGQVGGRGRRLSEQAEGVEQVPRRGKDAREESGQIMFFAGPEAQHEEALRQNQVGQEDLEGVREEAEQEEVAREDQHPLQQQAAPPYEFVIG